MGTKLIITRVAVVIAVAALTGSSAANPAIAEQSQIIGIVPTGVALSTGWGLIDTATIATDGAVTVTTRAAVAAQDLHVDVIVATIANG